MSSGMSKFGASPVATDVITASANLLSGRSHEPPYAAIAQWIEPAVKRGVALHCSTSWVIFRAAIEMFGHGISIARVAASESTAKPANPRRIGRPAGAFLRAPTMASRGER